jgi:putative salt-induced outer membrane protein YdiY
MVWQRAPIRLKTALRRALLYSAMPSIRRLAALLLLAAAPLAAADEIVLRNGDHIRGEIASLGGGKLVLRTGYAGEIALRWEEVVSISTDQPIEILRKGSRAPLRGTLQPLYGGRALLVAPDGAAHELALDEIAYLNPEPWQSGVGAAYAGRVTLSAVYTRGNTQDERINGDGEFTARAREHRYALSAKVERHDAPASGANTAWLAGASYDRFLAAERFVYARGSLEHDRAKDLAQRATAGAGYGAELAKGRASLTLRGGLDYVAVDRYAAANERYPALGWGIKAGYAPWFHEHEGFWNLEDTEAVLVRSKTGLRFPLLQGLGLSAQLNLDWERKPAPGRKSTDSTLLFGVDYAW